MWARKKSKYVLHCAHLQFSRLKNIRWLITDEWCFFSCGLKMLGKLALMHFIISSRWSFKHCAPSWDINTEIWKEEKKYYTVKKYSYLKLRRGQSVQRYSAHTHPPESKENLIVPSPVKRFEEIFGNFYLYVLRNSDIPIPSPQTWPNSMYDCIFLHFKVFPSDISEEFSDIFVMGKTKIFQKNKRQAYIKFWREDQTTFMWYDGVAGMQQEN